MNFFTYLLVKYVHCVIYNDYTYYLTTKPSVIQFWIASGIIYPTTVFCLNEKSMYLIVSRISL